MTKEIDYGILDKLTEEDLDIVSNNIDLDILLHPIKHNTKHYSRYTRILGRLDRRSALVQKNMPKIALELFHKEDKNFYHIFALEVMKLKNVFMEIVETDLEDNVTLEDLTDYSIEEYIVLLSQIDNLPKHNIDIRLFILQLKLNGLEIDNNKELDLVNQWRYHSGVKKLKEEFQIEKELLIKENKIDTSKKLKNLKVHFETLLTEKECNEKLLSECIEKREEEIVNLKGELTDKNNELLNAKSENLENTEHVNSMMEECSKHLETIESLQTLLNKQNKEYFVELQKEWEVKNSTLIEENLNIEEQIVNKQSVVDELSQKENELLISLESMKKRMDSYAINIEQQITNKLVAATVEKINESNKPKRSIAYGGLSDLYIIEGSTVPHNTLLSDNDEFLDMVDDNLENVGCKSKSNDFIDNISATINTNLVPLLCGFGARKVAMAYIAARYAEHPTVISIPNGFTNTGQLESAINESKTECVIIEDAFGKMSENILLPILRNNLKKQLFFCCEDINDLKYVDKYYYNYIQLTKITKMNNFNSEELNYGDAREVFNTVKYDNKSIGQQLVRYIIAEIDLLDTYKITRGNMMSYLIENLNHHKKNVVRMWMDQELNSLLSDEERDKVLETIENSATILDENIKVK